MSKNSLTFGECWTRGWHVIFLIVMLEAVARALYTMGEWLVKWLPADLQALVAVILVATFGPLVCYAIFNTVYPDYERYVRSKENPGTSQCPDCTAVMLSGQHTCPKCGWTGKPSRVEG
ncbi:MAG: hypothetical protein JWO08_4279 [Verrucomicrobiaceae bacterium]|nr:hypothetical protein [Verrucomicrobiaceae bacterium]